MFITWLFALYLQASSWLKAIILLVALFLTLHLSEGKWQSGQQLVQDPADTSRHFQEMTNVPETATLIQQFSRSTKKELGTEN